MEMSIEVYKILAGIATSLSTGHLGWQWYDRKQRDKKFDKIDKEVDNLEKEQLNIITKQAEHENKFVTEDKVRLVVKESIEPIKEDQKKTTEAIETMNEKIGETNVNIGRVLAILEERKSK